MKKKSILIFNIFLLLLSATALSQERYFTKSGKVSFFSTAPMENIEAHHRSVSVVLDKNGNIQFSLLMKGFEFNKALMQEHFNDKYVESNKFPKAEFKGQIINNNEINYSVDGSYPARVKGKLTLHGQTRDIETKGLLIVKGDKISIEAGFNVTVADYNITIPKIYRDNIARSVKVTVDCTLSPL
jgi:hypothetical protein